jgi:hypothetical protein
LRSEIRCIVPGTKGGGPTTVALGVALVRSEKRPAALAGGATAEIWSRLGLPPSPGRNSGGGATTTVACDGWLRCQFPVADNGTSGKAGFSPSKLGGTGPFSLMSGGAMLVRACSGATHIREGRPAAAFPFVLPAARPGLLPSAGYDREGG